MFPSFLLPPLVIPYRVDPQSVKAATGYAPLPPLNVTRFRNPVPFVLTLKTFPRPLEPPLQVIPNRVEPTNVRSPAGYRPGSAPPVPLNESKLLRVCAWATDDQMASRINMPARATRLTKRRASGFPRQRKPLALSTAVLIANLLDAICPC
jgi:hypothetical protein